MPEPRGNIVTPIGRDADDNLYALLVDASGRLQVVVVSSAVPTGAALAAKQLPDGHNVTVDNASIPVTGAFWQATQPVSIAAAVTANAGVRAGQIQRAYYSGVPGDTALHTLATITANAILLSLDFTSDSSSSQLRLAGATILYIAPHAIAGAIYGDTVFSHLQASGGESSLLKIGLYDAAHYAYSMFLKRELRTATSLEVVYKAGSITANVGIGITWVELT